MTMVLVLTKTIETILVNVVQEIAVGILLERDQDGE